MRRPDLDLIDTDCLLKNLKNGMELVVSTEEKGVGLTSLVVRSVAEILKHGLKEPKVSFWHIVRDLTHSSTRQCLARSLRHIHDNQQRGFFWIYYTLVEGSLDSYMQCLITDKQNVNKHYLSYALLRDNFCTTKFILLLTSLAQINITPLDSTTCVGLRLEVNHTTSISSETSLLSTPSSGISSPADSGLHESMEETSDSVFLPSKELTSSTDSTLTPVEAAFSDCSLSSATEPPLSKRVLRQRKRVSFHETVTGDGPKGTVWERRSCDVETMAWWKAGLTDTGEKGEDALDMERGAPEGSEDPQAVFSETEIPKEQIEVTIKPPKPIPAKRPLTIKLEVGRNRLASHVMNIYPGPYKPETNLDWDDSELHAESIHAHAPKGVSGMERILNTTIYKMYNMLDSEGRSYICLLAKQELCFLSLTNNQTLNMHRIQYKDMNYIGVGPSPEHVMLEDGRKFLLTTRGEDFCSWLHYAVSKETKKTLDFIRISPENVFASVLATCKEMKIADVIYNSWVLISDSFNGDEIAFRDYLMFSFDPDSGYWEPAFVEISCKGDLEIRPCLKGCRNLQLPLCECSICERCNSSLRPHTFKLRFDKRKPKDQLTIYLAAPDENSVSCWMRAILIAVANKKEPPKILPQPETHPNEGHHLIATERALILVNSQRDRLVSKTLLTDVSSVFTGPAYLILELGCHEVEDKASDWILYFYSEEIKTGFMQFIVEMRPELHQMVYKHKEISCNWVKCEDERHQLDSGFQQIISYVTSL